MVRIQRLQAGEGARWRSIRLQALEEAPYAFGTTLAEAAQWSMARWEDQVVEFATFVAVASGEDVGVARGAEHRSSELRELISMWVSPKVRRQGIGVQLMESVAAWAKADGANALVLDVIASNHSAVSLYEGAGFRRVAGMAASQLAPHEVRLVRSLAG